MPSAAASGLPAQRVAIHQDHHRTTEQLTTEHRAAELATARHVLTGYDVLLLRDTAGDAAALSFGELYNLLNVNTV